jgi:5-hydroxytryptamine receptor 1
VKRTETVSEHNKTFANNTEKVASVALEPLNPSIQTTINIQKDSQIANTNQVGHSSNTNLVHSNTNVNVMIKKRAKIDIKRERKAAKTLGVIMSCFILCWLPFFLMQIVSSVCKDCKLVKFLENGPLFTILTWLGYLNSLLNPIIYTIFSPDFRNAFAKILFGKYRSKNQRGNFRSTYVRKKHVK